MKHPLRSAVTTTGRRMAGARSLWRANGMREEQFGRPIIGIANSFTQLVPGHVHLHEIGQQVKQRIEACGCFAAEFDTIAVDDGIAMGHDGMLYSLPSREIIADGVNGLIIPSHDSDALYRAMRRLATDPTQCRQLAAPARRLIADRYEQSYVRKCLLDFYRQILPDEAPQT